MELLQEVKENNMEKESFFSTKTIVVFIVGIMIGFFGAWLPMRDSSGPVDDIDSDMETVLEETSDNTKKTASDIIFSGKNAITVRDQIAGVTVDVELVTLENVGWVVIHESNNGILGNALGAQLFEEGPGSGTVELLRGMEAGKTYYATIRQDDGDRAFDLTKDLLLSDKNGNPVQVKFKAI